MTVVNLYGKQFDPAATFDYPQPRMPMRMAPPTYFQKPDASYGVLGREPRVLFPPTDVQLDPSSVYSYKQRGLGGVRGLSGDPCADATNQENAASQAQAVPRSERTSQQKADISIYERNKRQCFYGTTRGFLDNLPEWMRGTIIVAGTLAGFMVVSRVTGVLLKGS